MATITAPATFAQLTDISYTYDEGPYALGRLTGVNDQSGSTDFGYDERGRLESLWGQKKGPVRDSLEHRFSESEVDKSCRAIIELFNKCNQLGKEC